jgi:hypothetical protein
MVYVNILYNFTRELEICGNTLMLLFVGNLREKLQKFRRLSCSVFHRNAPVCVRACECVSAGARA